MLFAETALGVSTTLVAYLALFSGVGLAFIFVNLLVGRFLRPDNPSPEKGEIYECGEPTIGSSFVQFDLRFYVIALVFIIFDVEVAFLFPWATVFGKATALWHADSAAVVQVVDGAARLTNDASQQLTELGFNSAAISTVSPTELQAGAEQLATLAVLSGGLFFVILFVGFAYEWRTGALDWVRAIRAQSRLTNLRTLRSTKTTPQESVLSA